MAVGSSSSLASLRSSTSDTASLWTDAVRVTVLSHRVETDASTGASHVVYTICTQEGSGDFQVEVDRRWSHVRSLYAEINAAWRQQLQRSGLRAPPFNHHSFSTKNKFDPSLLLAREAELQRLLQFYCVALRVSLERGEGPEVLRIFLSAGSRAWESRQNACSVGSPASSSMAGSPAAGFLGSPAAGFLSSTHQGLSAVARAINVQASGGENRRAVDPPYNGRPELSAAELQAACDAPTPRARFFAPEKGWPSCVAADSSRGREACCQHLTLPPMAAAGGRATREASAPPLGTVMLEVLEAAGLPNLDTLSLTDAYGIVLLEGIAARTCTIMDDLNPKWHAEAPRAFELPITDASSSLIVALFDDDSDSGLGTLVDDDPIGRVVLQPCELRPRTTYDAWWPLTHQAVGEPPGSRGAVRLRLSVVWAHEREILIWPIRTLHLELKQLPDAPPRHVLRLTSQRTLAAIEYAYHGSQPERRYSAAVLRANLAEAARLALALKATAAPLRRILFWKQPLYSVVLLAAWEWLTAYPRYIPATMPLLMLLALDFTYRTAKRRPTLLRPLPFWRLVASLLIPPRAEHAEATHMLTPLEGTHHDEAADGDDKHKSSRTIRRLRAQVDTRPKLLQRAGSASSAVGTTALAAAKLAVLPARKIVQTGASAVRTGAAHLTDDGSGERHALEDEAEAMGAPATANASEEEVAAAAAREASDAEGLSDEAALETVTAVWDTLVFAQSTLWQATRRALHIRAPALHANCQRKRSALERVKLVTNSIDSNAINPLAWVLQPVQNAIGETQAATTMVREQRDNASHPRPRTLADLRLCGCGR